MVPNADADKFEEAMFRPGLTFVTDDNLEQMKNAQDMQTYWFEHEREKLEKEKTEMS